MSDTKNEYAAKEMDSKIAKWAMRFFKDVGSKIHRITCIANKHAFVTTEVVEVEEVVLKDGGPIHKQPGDIVKPDESVTDYDKDWVLEGIMTAKEIDTSGLPGNMRERQEKCSIGKIEVLSEMLAFIALVEQGLDLERPLKK